MTSTAEPMTTKRVPKVPPPWMRRTRRVLDILATGGMVWLTEPQPPKKPKRAGRK